MESTSLKRGNAIPLYSLFIANSIPWFILQTTGSAAQTGITGFFTILPVVLTGFLGETFIDRLGCNRSSIISDLASGVTTALIPLHYYTVGLEFRQLMNLVFLGACGAFSGTSTGVSRTDHPRRLGCPASSK